jgi:hypothetical protein
LRLAKASVMDMLDSSAPQRRPAAGWAWWVVAAALLWKAEVAIRLAMAAKLLMG